MGSLARPMASGTLNIVEISDSCHVLFCCLTCLSFRPVFILVLSCPLAYCKLE